MSQEKSQAAKTILTMEFLIKEDEAAKLMYWVDMEDEAHLRLFSPTGSESELLMSSTAYTAIRLAMKHLNEIALKLKKDVDSQTSVQDMLKPS